MASLKLNHIYKVYPNGAKAVNDFCMEIEDKEFIVFVGPSGCGKSTTLRMIAGLEVISAGELQIDGEVVNDVEPKNRDIAMVFQNYALYPHLTVYENMAFGLKLRKMPKAEIDRRVKEAAEILGITEYLKRKPSAMSGGQRQRVALGRAIVREPKVFLLDEPLSNLDAKLRTTMRAEISKLHKKLQTTFIYVTHDQVEAMTMGTRIVVMKDGFVQQIDTPRNLYNYPVNKFVAGFIGTPQMNFYKGKLKAEGDKVRVTFDNTNVDLLAPYEYFAKADVSYLDGKKSVILGIRLEHISVDPDAYPFKAKCYVNSVEDLGIDSQVYADFNADAKEAVLETDTRVVIKAPAGTLYRLGDEIEISMDLSKLHIFDAETERTIAERIPAETTVKGKAANGILSVLGTEIKLPQAVQPADGEYEIHIPTSAIGFGGSIPAKYVKDEDVNGQRLVQMDANGKAVFVLADENSVTDQGLSIDLKRCGFVADGREVITALPSENKLIGKLSKHKEGKQIEFTLEMGEKSFGCPADMANRMINGLGTHPFDAQLEIRFAPCDYADGDNGIPARVVRVLDYGNELFAECSVKELLPAVKGRKKTEVRETVAEKTVYLKVDRGFKAEYINLVPDMSKISVYDVGQDIRLV